MDKLFEIQRLDCFYDRPFVSGESRIVVSIEDLVIPKGKTVFIVGESGIGKSTILEVLGLMNNTIVPSSDTVFRFYEQKDQAIDLIQLWTRKDDRAVSAFRLKHFSFIFQSTNLMRNFTALENVAITRMLQGYSATSSIERASSTLEELGLPHIGSGRMAQELSGGQQQRLAFARAVLPDFSVLFGDEPTGNLDEENALKVMGLLAKKLEGMKDSSAVIVTHDMSLALAFADIIIKIRKEFRPSPRAEEKLVTQGVVDSSCVYYPKGNGPDRVWTNGTLSWSDTDFERFLKSISDGSE